MMFRIGPLVDSNTDEVILDDLLIADGIWSRFRGLQFRQALPDGTGLLLVPCHSIHTLFVRFPIDVISLDRQARILEVRRNVRPWKVFVPQQKPWAILEVSAGTIDVEQGMRLELKNNKAAHRRKHLQFLQFNCNNRE